MPWPSVSFTQKQRASLSTTKTQAPALVSAPRILTFSSLFAWSPTSEPMSRLPPFKYACRPPSSTKRSALFRTGAASLSSTGAKSSIRSMSSANLAQASSENMESISFAASVSICP